ncbi:hypothetical protein TNCV_2667451 [Trichonephila clavipes]|nr:hypothetical protein TNCV_2667451 [Trichonephila clavipes]
MNPFQTQKSMVFGKGIPYKCTLSRSLRCSRHQRVDEANISIPLAVGQIAANCLDEAVRSFTAIGLQMSIVAFRRSLLIGPLLPNSHLCGSVPLPQSSYCAIGKSSFSKADNSIAFKLLNLLEFLLILS